MSLPYDPARTALLIVDPYNDFVNEGGKLYDLTKQTADAGGWGTTTTGRNIVVTGFVANSCVEATTARTGMELGFDVTLLRDATAAFDQAGMDAARVNATMYAHADLTTTEFITALTGADVAA